MADLRQTAVSPHTMKQGNALAPAPVNSLDMQTLELLAREGLSVPRDLNEIFMQGMPANTAGISDLVTYNVPRLSNTSIGGFVVSDPRLSQKEQNRAARGAIFAKPGAKPFVFAHEAEHLMAKKQLGFPQEINRKFDELINTPKARENFVLAAMNAAPYLKEKYGLQSAYFNKQLLRNNKPEVLLYEQLADLAGIEYANNVDLTKDPELRKTLFKDPAVRETYNAITGLRQTRLDPRDLPPYTRQPEQNTGQSLFERAKSLLGIKR